MSAIPMNNDEKLTEIGRKAISRAVEYEEFDRPLGGFFVIELFLFCMGLAFATIITVAEFVFGGMEEPGFSELIWTVIVGFGLMALIFGLMENFKVFRSLVLLGFTLFWTFLITLGAYNLNVGIGGLIGVAIVGFAVSYFFHFVGFNALND